MPDMELWAYSGGDLRVEKRRFRWTKEVLIAEYRLDVRAQEEKMMKALREAREARKAKQPPNPEPLTGFLGALVSLPDPFPPEPTAVPIPWKSDRRLWDTKYSLDEAALAIAGHNNRFHSAEGPTYIEQKLEEDIRLHEDVFPHKHPLQVKYEMARQKAIDRGEPDPGDIDHILKARWPSHRLEHRYEQANPPVTYRDEDGVIVQRGFDLSKRGPDIESYSMTTLSCAHRNRSNTFDDRFLSERFIAADEAQRTPEQAERRVPRNRNQVAARIWTRHAERASLGREITTADGVEDDDDDSDAKSDTTIKACQNALMRSLNTPDPAEGIAAYHERRAKWFAVDGLGSMAMRHRGTV